MAKRIEKSEAVEVANRANLTGFDGKQLAADVREVNRLQADHREEGEPIKAKKKGLKHDRGYHMGGFSVLQRAEKMEDADAKDFARTIVTGFKALGYLDADMVDLMEGGANG